MHNDEPTLRDILGRESLVEEVGEAIATCIPPQVFGIHGDWGLGKTSFLHQVQWYLTGQCPQQSEEEAKRADQSEKGKYEKIVQTVWFDAWRYQHEEVPVVALLQEMRAQLSWGHQISGATARKLEIAVRGALFSMEELTKKIGVQPSKFRDASREWEAKNLAASLPSHTLREHLREAIEQLLPKKKKNFPPPRLVVFIDDIDRCEPEVAYRLLEGLKIYLTLDNCVFILGMNQKAIEGAIGSQIKVTTDNPKSRAAAYMEKLCQNVWQLPTIRDPGEILHNLLEQTVENERVRTWVRKAVKGIPCLPPNPRRLKGLANLIERLAPRLPPEPRLADDAAIIEAQILVIVASIYQFHPELYIRWEADSDFYNRIFDRCQGDQLENIPVLHSLVLPKQRSEKDTEPTPGDERVSTYPDPTATNVFWIQPLILKLGNELPPKQFERYLHSTVEQSD